MGPRSPRTHWTRLGSAAEPVVHHWHAKLSVKAAYLVGFLLCLRQFPRSTLCRDGRQYEICGLFDSRWTLHTLSVFSERRVDWRHREHSSLSRNEIRAYGLFLGQKERTSVGFLQCLSLTCTECYCYCQLAKLVSAGGDWRSRFCCCWVLSLFLSLSLISAQAATDDLVSAAAGFSPAQLAQASDVVCSEPGSAGFSLSLYLSLRTAHLEEASLSLSFSWVGGQLRTLFLSLSNPDMYFAAAAARWRPYVAWVKSALWCCHAEATFPRSRPLGRWSRWVSRNETQLIWGLGDGNHSWTVVSLICLLHSSCKTEKVSFFCNHSFWSTNCSKASKAARGMHNYLVITLFVVLYT
jgi:hypothetical protein